MEDEIVTTPETQNGTQETIESSELNGLEAEDLLRSMDMSIAFWGRSQEPPEKIPATKLKCAVLRPGKASSTALRIWEKMAQPDLDKIREIEIVLMREGEVDTEDLMSFLRSIIDGTGMEFEEMLKAIDEDPIEATTSLTNELLHIYNQNEPPEIIEEEEFGTFIPFNQPGMHQEHSAENRQITNRIKYLLNRAERLELPDVKIPSSPYLSDRSKLSLLEKQIKAKIKIKNIQRTLGKSEKKMVQRSASDHRMTRYGRKKVSGQQRRDIKRSSLADRPRFKTAVKAESVRYEDLIKHAPDLSKRMKRVHEIRKKFLDKNKSNMEGRSTNHMYSSHNSKFHHYSTPFSYNSYNSHKGKSPKPRKRYMLPSVTSNCFLQNYESEESVSDTKINITIESNDLSKIERENKNSSDTNHTGKISSTENILVQMKKMLKEAVKEVALSSNMNYNSPQSSRDQMVENFNEETERIVLATNDKSEVTTFNENATEHSDTVIMVTQETGLSPYRNFTNSREEGKVSTEVKVSNRVTGKSLKVQVISKLAGMETEEEASKPTSQQQNIQEAISVLKQYIAMNNNDNLNNEELIDSAAVDETGNEVHQHIMFNNVSLLNVADHEENSEMSETVTTELVVECEAESPPKESEHEHMEIGKLRDDFLFADVDVADPDLPPVQAFAVTMLMPIATNSEEMRSFSPFGMGSVVMKPPYSGWIHHEGDGGDTRWTNWSGPSNWHLRDDEGHYSHNQRNESDSLYVNASEEQICRSSSEEESSSIQSQLTLSSLLFHDRSEESLPPSNKVKSIISKTFYGLYLLILNTLILLLDTISKPIGFLRNLKG